MKDISYDLIERLREFPDDPGAAEKVLLAESRSEEPDGAYYAALSPDRSNVFEWLPFTKDMDVLEAGASYGAYAELSAKVRSLDIRDRRDEDLEAVRFRCPKLLRENGGNVGLMKHPGQKRYDAALVPLMTGLPSEDTDGDVSAYLKETAGYLKHGGFLALAADNPDALKFSAGGEEQKDGTYFGLDAAERLREALSFKDCRVFYPLPDAVFARDIFSDGRLPGTGDFKGVSESWTDRRFALCDEEKLYETLAKAGAFPRFAPAYLFLFTGYLEGEENGEAVRFSGEEALPVYIRYNRSRAPQYRLKTEIFSGKDGSFVRKTALTEEADAHVDSFREKYELLSRTANRGLCIAEPRIGRTGEGLSYADFDYIEGTTLAEEISVRISDGRAPEGQIKLALDALLGSGIRPCHNLDVLFENVLVKDGQYWLTDYEWVFEEELVREYVIWRILHYFWLANRDSLYSYNDETDFLSRFGLSGEGLLDCEKREASFQEYVRGGEDVKNAFRRPVQTAEVTKQFDAKIKELTDWNLRLQDEVEEHKTMLKKEREVERLSQNHIRNIEKIVAVQKEQLGAMQGELVYLRKHQSIPSRIVRALIGVIDRAAPAGSPARKRIHYVKNTLRHPVQYLRLYCSEEGRRRIRGDFAIGGEFAEGGILRLPETERPLVSIIIPAYNQVAYTYACIRSILLHTDPEETPYEVILADDVSNDATKEIGKYIEGLVISRNEENLGFLKNCNRAADRARGAYLFFLNNDTKVSDNWLSSLIKLMREDPAVGMTGSKLVYPDGRLQEAGGIIWSDASGWNYGRLDDPEKPQYNYVKEVDYISGAAILIRHELWDEIGGFDERYAPAYCEDSDLAFEVRRRGRKVVFQPLSVVTHFEGVSNGTDVEGTGLKRFQTVNSVKFREKWAAELRTQSVNTGDPDPFAARDRSQRKPCVLFVDHYVPNWDKDAGSRTTYQYLCLFLKKGWNVKFLGDNFLHEEPYTTKLQQMGIEVLYGEEMQSGIFDWLRKEAPFIDCAFLNRPHIAVKYIDFLRDETDIRCIFYGHDLHSLRLMREYELTGDIRKKREADYWKGVEYSVMQKAHMSYYPSQTEVDEIHRNRPEIPAKAITAYMWDSTGKPCEPLSRRDGLLFVGGFKHPPNEDGLLWFADHILPLIKEKLPGVKLRVAGSNPTDAVKALSERGDTEVLGFVSDERLAELYRTTRLVVVPLRYGAGVKGKVVEALRCGCAVVTTEVGAEGIPEAETAMLIAKASPRDGLSEEQSFADLVVKAYDDAEMLPLLTERAQALIRRHYSPETAWSVIEEDFRK